MGDIYVITTKSQKHILRRELPQLKDSHLLLEPFRNNTAPAILFSCLHLKKKYGPDEVVSFYPADHLIQNHGMFRKTMTLAIQAAEKTARLVILGIRPAFPATGYGYLQSGPAVRGMPGVFGVRRFVEKPNRKRARSYLQKGNFYWNSGIFTWKTGVLIRAMEKYSPDQGYEKKGVSIDVAVLEKADQVAFCKTSMDWCDLGSWDMLLEKSPRDPGGSYTQGAPIHRELKESLVIHHGRTPLVVLGVTGLMIVQTPQGTLICRKGRSEEAARLIQKK